MGGAAFFLATGLLFAALGVLLVLHWQAPPYDPDE